MVFSEEAGSKVLLGTWLFPLLTPYACFSSLGTRLEMAEQDVSGVWGIHTYPVFALIQILCQHLRGSVQLSRSHGCWAQGWQKVSSALLLCPGCIPGSWGCLWPCLCLEHGKFAVFALCHVEVLQHGTNNPWEPCNNGSVGRIQHRAQRGCGGVCSSAATWGSSHSSGARLHLYFNGAVSQWCWLGWGWVDVTQGRVWLLLPGLSGWFCVQA